MGRPNVISLSCAARARAAMAARRAGCRRLTNEPICGRRAAAPVLFGQGASAPGRSRAASAAVSCWAARRTTLRAWEQRARRIVHDAERAWPKARYVVASRVLWAPAYANRCSARAASATSRRAGGYHDEKWWRTPWRAAPPLQSVRLPTRKWKSGLPLRAGSAQRLSPELRRGPACVRLRGATAAVFAPRPAARERVGRRAAGQSALNEALQRRARRTARRQLLAVVSRRRRAPHVAHRGAFESIRPVSARQSSRFRVSQLLPELLA